MSKVFKFTQVYLGHLKYDEEKGLTSDITVEKVIKLFEKQNGICNICNCDLKTSHYEPNDRQQFSIDRINPFYGHTDDNIQLLCWVVIMKNLIDFKKKWLNLYKNKKI